jgi:hypothetical protein
MLSRLRILWRSTVNKVLGGSLTDGLDGEGTDLHLDGDRNAVDVGAHVGSDFAQRALQRHIANTGRILKRGEDFQFAAAVIFTFTRGEFAGDRIRVREVVNASSSGFEQNFLVAFEADERAVRFSLEIGGNSLTIGFSFGREHGRMTSFILP